MDNVEVRTALVSVSDKSGLAELAKSLHAQNIKILSTGGTAKTMRDAGVNVTDVSTITEFPEMMDGRVKTLHPKIHGGILADRRQASHMAALEKHDIGAIDLVIINLYPFEKSPGIETIDIGGPAMVRAAAKNHSAVTIITDAEDYENLTAHLKENDGHTTFAFRQAMAQKAFARTATYDLAIAGWLGKPNLRYGENPHQSASVLKAGARVGVLSATQLQGKELSYNNINDTDAAFELVSEFTDAPAVAIIKHANPCGVAVSGDIITAWENALKCDPVSAFGGIVAINQPVTAPIADKMSTLFLEVIIAPAIDDAAAAILSAKKNLRVLITGQMPDPTTPRQIIKSVAGGLLVQDHDTTTTALADLKVVTKNQPTEAEKADMLFAEKVAKHVKSNAIIFVKDGATLGIGAGQMSRIDATHIAVRKAGDQNLDLTGSVVASDAFFPFADGVEALADAGATAVVQPGGSKRDEDVIAAADEKGISMTFSGTRHFKH